jgi:hypothetical protein
MRHLLAAVCSFAPVGAAQTFVVDAANGVGTHFTTIAAAVAAVPDGATVLVRPGQYAGFHVQAKGLTLLGGAGVRLSNPTYQPSPILVSATTAGQSVVIRGLTTSGTRQEVEVTDCAGLVLLEDIADSSRGTYDMPTEVRITRSSQVLLRAMQIGMGVVVALDSQVVLESCAVYGTDARYGGIILVSQPAVTVQAGSLQVVACTLEGGNGDSVFGTNRPALVAGNADLRVRAPATLRVGAASTMPQSPAIDGTGTLRLDPAVVLVTNTQPIGAGLATQIYEMPAVVAVSAGPGGTLAAAANGPTGSFTALILGFCGPPLAVPGITGSVWIEPSTCVCAAFGVPQPAVPVAATIPVPGSVGCLGVRFAWQSVASVGSRLEASNPTQSLVR